MSVVLTHSDLYRVKGERDHIITLGATFGIMDLLLIYNNTIRFELHFSKLRWKWIRSNFFIDFRMTE